MNSGKLTQNTEATETTTSISSNEQKRTLKKTLTCTRNDDDELHFIFGCLVEEQGS
ncbi:hypothetical protein Bhyg_02891 [Pseudolycoriella hygida]|uniref:Uncharacterized protein n=1 Tax=Pseudolycoriella hygida TaxID=35572 RepID=A0A9Q0NCN2_9DIPT|nr:hypothetical protein Bhyg_02891 [Pseudolycoriella hygida]